MHRAVSVGHEVNRKELQPSSLSVKFARCAYGEARCTVFHVTDAGVETTGAIVKRLRTDRQLRREELAVKSGIPYGTIETIERGRSEPTASTLRKLAQALNVSADILLGLKRTLRRKSADQRKRAAA